MNSKKGTPIWNPITIIVEGKTISGSYSINKNDWMTVRMDGGGSKSARGGPGAKGIARLILRELFDEAEKDKHF